MEPASESPKEKKKRKAKSALAAGGLVGIGALIGGAAVFVAGKIASHLRKKKDPNTEESVENPNAQPSMPTLSTVAEAQEDRAICVICMERPVDVVFFPCRHVCCCAQCVAQCALDKCPVDRAPIERYEKVFVA